ncbi:Secreted effector protein pipB2 [Gimesia panareensis]|uniref:Secreted effector protein pipB2 n=1 Tax=Gimesia panareensis TaxID=2527978 RepID=A0A518FJ99_9PLAN|nr:pentapeptide repeat-containing protein [Gimesia panareensis]QDV16425.1 Secreted effector protein pipB2 [Gimesia panareensis]
MARILIAFVTVILSFCVASALLFLGYEWYEQKLIDVVWWAGISSIVVTIVCLALWAFRDKIFQFLKLSTKTGLQHMIDPVAEIVEHGFDGRVKEAARETKVLLHRLLSRYAAIKTMNWIIGTSFGFLAIFATMAATAVLVKQNNLINTQNTYFQKQNEKLDAQNTLIESQNKYFQDQNSKIQKQLDEQTVERQRADRNRLIGILYEEKDVETGTIGKLFGLVSKEIKRKIPKASLRLRQEAALEFMKLEWDAGRYGEELDLSGAILCGLDLSHDRLKKVGLENVLQDANLRDAHLEETQFTQTHLEGAHLSGAELTESVLEGASLEGAHLSGANMKEAVLVGASLEGAHLSGAHLSEINLERAVLKFANLEGADLSFANLEGADLSFTNLVGAVLKFANLEGVHLEGAHSSGAEFSFTNLEKADLKFINLEGAHLKGAHLEGAVLKFANLEGADLSFANLVGAQLERARLGRFNLKGANLSGANLEGAEVNSHDWIKKLQNLDPSAKNFEYWSVAEKIIINRGTIYILVGPLEAEKPIPKN